MGWRGAAVSVVLLTRLSGSLGRLTLLQPLAGRPSGPGSPSGPRREDPPRLCLRREETRAGRGEELGGGFRDPRPSGGAGG